ncbi:hypothetical protein LA76x_3455 [Lysobacter antibioticus]|uniref:Uncharacterized protein n=1 Tax=Lysobacter antibioticus TaxID=84531 RepID=A0A0S2FDE4_LYSAN|nr:hypothetical protein LA76x_3455 [Lysobacter antibioticus]
MRSSCTAFATSPAYSPLLEQRRRRAITLPRGKTYFSAHITHAEDIDTNTRKCDIYFSGRMKSEKRIFP